MDAGTQRSDEAEGLRLLRAFLSLPRDKRAEVMALVEGLARAQVRSDDGRPEGGRPEGGTGAAPR